MEWLDSECLCVFVKRIPQFQQSILLLCVPAKEMGQPALSPALPHEGCVFSLSRENQGCVIILSSAVAARKLGVSLARPFISAQRFW